MRGAEGDIGRSLRSTTRTSRFRGLSALLAFARDRIILRFRNVSTGWLPRLVKRGSDKRSSRMSEKILREIEALEGRLTVIEGRLDNSTNVKARIRDRLKALTDRILEIENKMGAA